MQNYSVLMSVYHKEKAEYLKTAMQSMFDQTAQTNDFVLVCDGPLTDELDSVIDEIYALHSDILNIVRLSENRGLGNALNEGLKHCKNELVARMDSDDISLPDRCKKQLLNFENNSDLVLLGTAIKTFDDNGNGIVRSVVSDFAEIKRIMRRGSAFHHPTVMFKKSVILKCGGYDSQLTRRQDYDLFSKIIHNGYIASNINEVLLMYRADEVWTSRNKNAETCKTKMIVQKRILKRKDCSLMDYLIVWAETEATRILPENLYKKIYCKLKGTA